MLLVLDCLLSVWWTGDVCHGSGEID